MTLEALAVVVMAVYFLGVGGTDMWLVRRIARYIQDIHPKAWNALGVASPYSLRFASYVYYKEYRGMSRSLLIL